MRATRYLAKLFDMAAAHGEISAFDSYAAHLYVGTDKGAVLHFHVEGLPEYTRREHTSQTALDRAPLTSSTEAQQPQESVFTNLLSRVVVSDQRRRVQLLQHSRVQALLFVLCDDRLTLWSTAVSATATLSAAAGADLTFLCEVGSGIGTFFVSPLPPLPSPSPVQWREGHKRRQDPLYQSTSSASSSSSPFSARPPVHTRSGSAGSATRYDHFNFLSRSASAAPGVGGGGDQSSLGSALAAASRHRICAAQKGGKGLAVYEFDAVVASGDGGRTVPPRAVLTREFLLPEPALCLVMVNTETICVGLRQEYTLLSLVSGASRSIRRLGAGGGVPLPLLVLGDDGEVHMRCHRSVFSATLKVGGGPDPQPATTAGGSGSLSAFRVLGRTVHVEDDVELVISRYPFLFVFAATYCDVFSAYEDEAVERLPLSGCLYASPRARGEAVFAASRGTVWMVRLHPLRTQLADLVSSARVGEALQLLASQRARTGRRLEELELELHLMAGFTHLHRCRPAKAMQHFGAHVDPRDLVLHLPECLPPSPEAYSPALRKLLAKARKQKDERATVVLAGVEGGGSSGSGSGSSITRRIDSLLDGEDEGPEDGGSGGRGGGYWRGWRGPCPYNTCTTREALLRTWLETFESYPFVSLPSSSSSPGGGGESLMLRQVPHLGPASATFFVEHCWESLKDAVVKHFTRQLSELPRERVTEAGSAAAEEDAEDEEGEGTASLALPSSSAAVTSGAAGATAELFDRDVRERAMSFALLVLALERQDHRAAYAAVREGKGLRVVDCYDLLCHLREYHLLAMLLFRRGFAAEALRLIRSRLRLPEVAAVVVGPPPPLPPPSGAAETETVTATALAMLPASVRRKIQETLLSPKSAAATTATRVVHYGDTAVPTSRNGAEKKEEEDDGAAVPSSFVVDATAPKVLLPVSTIAGEEGSRDVVVFSVEAPGDLAEVFYLVSTADLCALKAALFENPSLAQCRDGDGCTALHHLFVLLSPLNKPSASATATAANTSSPRTAEVDGSSLLQLVLAAASLLVGFGCPVHALTYDTRRSCLDVAAEVCDGLLFDVIVASLLSVVEVNAACHAAVASVEA